MKDNVFQILVIVLLASILMVLLSRKQTGRYVEYGNGLKQVLILDTSTGEIYMQDIGHFNIIDDVSETQKERDKKNDSLKSSK